MRMVVGQSIWHKMGQQKMAVWGGGEVLPYISHIGMYRRKGRGFCAVQAWDKGYNNSQTPPPIPTGTPTGNLHKSVWQVELLILNLRYVIKIWLKERMQYKQVSISFVLDKKRDLEYILLTQETLTLLNSSKSWPFFFSCRWQIK